MDPGWHAANRRDSPVSRAAARPETNRRRTLASVGDGDPARTVS